MTVVKSFVVGAHQGTVVPSPVASGSVTIKVASEAITVFEAASLGDGDDEPRMHSHPGFDETIYVVSGNYEFFVEKERIVASAGMLVHLHRGVFHGARSLGDDAKLIGVAVPGIEEFA